MPRMSLKARPLSFPPMRRRLALVRRPRRRRPATLRPPPKLNRPRLHPLPRLLPLPRQPHPPRPPLTQRPWPLPRLPWRPPTHPPLTQHRPPRPRRPTSGERALPASALGVFFALTSAIVWGSGDFSGGVATRRSSQYYVLALSALSGIVLLGALALWQREAWPPPTGWVWAALGGVSGALGIACLYRALSMGHAASVAPMTAVISAALPAVVGALLAGLPGPSQLVGFVVAVPGLWLVSGAAAGQAAPRASRPELLLAVLAGLGFGGFFVFIGQVQRGYVYTPLVIARSLTLATGLLLILGRRLPLPALGSNPVALLAGLLDAGGNIFYVLARQYTRLDVAAVLSSLYPAATVLLAWLLLKEHISRRQWFGAALCVLAVALIAL